MTLQCQSCGSFVTRDFARVFGSNDGEVYGCLDCMTASQVKRGAARGADVETVDLSGEKGMRR